MADVQAQQPVGERLTNNYAPITIKCEAEFLPVKGELPRELRGTLFRNGPNPQFPVADPRNHWFTGDGMLHAFTLAKGRAAYRNRWIRTAKWQAEHDAGRALFAGFGGDRLPGAPAVQVKDEGVANTNVVWHAGRLLALEEAHLPIEIDPRTLATDGQRDFGALRGPFTAHPKIDPVSGEMIFFGYGASGPLSAGMTYGTMDSSGAVTRFERFDAPYASMVHDFVVTARHVLFPILPLTASLQRAMRGGPPFAWEPEKGAAIGVLPRGGAIGDMKWFRGDAAYVFHVMNAWEDGDKIYADVMQFEEPPLFPHADGSAPDPMKSRARLCRWTFDLTANTDRFTQDYLDELTGEFPRIDDRRAGLKHRHGWYACAAPGRQHRDSFDAIAHVDAESTKRNLYLLPDGDATSEPVFVPRATDAEEGDGWLLAVIWRAAERRSDLVVLEAGDVERGPIATVELSHRVPFGFHGNFVPA
ncbi:MAG: carotenoid oxygenase family protein [Methylobacteriaceae bacterium]|nr:carotenoid oxygenase family protein [Methylobacteriaceae bacterium]